MGSFTMFPNHEPGGRGPPSKPLVQILRGGGVLSINAYAYELLVRIEMMCVTFELMCTRDSYACESCLFDMSDR